MPIQDVFLRIERIDDYSPVAPQDKTPPNVTYKRDGMKSHGHDNGVIPDAEVAARALTAVVYREYLDANYLVPRTTKIVAADLNEPIWDRRVPGTVVYTHVGQTLKVHVLNADIEPHSLHVHGVEYGIDSDGSWPFGTEASDGRRSDEICPGQSWTYTFNVREEMIGAWPFHDHAHHSDGAVKRGLFGAIIVTKRPFKVPIPAPLPTDFDQLEKLILEATGGRVVRIDALPERAQAIVAQHLDILDEWLVRGMGQPSYTSDRLHVPIFLHEMVPEKQKAVFDSGDLEENGVGTFTQVFDAAGTFDYFCQFHPIMTATVEVIAGAPISPVVNILDAPAMGFYPQTVQVAPGGSVTWNNMSMQHHTVTSKDGAAMNSHCINGRAFVGNSPTILARAGQKIRWYLFNLDFGLNWHNFHPHAVRWQFAGENIDVRSLGPAESFVADTEAPMVLLLPPDMKALQDKEKKPKDAQLYRLMGDFLFHCHVHHHMMNGMVGAVRSYQDVWLTPALKQKLEDEIGIIPIDPSNPIPSASHGRCQKHGAGHWEELVGVTPAVTFMHACLLPQTSKVLYWGYTEANQSRLFDPAGGGLGAVAPPANQPATLPGFDADSSDLWSAEHTFLDDANGRLLAHGGFTGPGTNAFAGNVHSFVFDPTTESWSATGDTADSRFYATTLTLADSKALTLFGSGAKSIEVFDPTANGGLGVWSAPAALPVDMHHHEFYPWTYLLPGGKLFIAGPHNPSQRFEHTNPAGTLESFPTLAGERSTGGEKGTSVLLPLRAPTYAPSVMVLGGDPAPAQKTAEIIDLSTGAPAWKALPELNVARPEQVNSVLLPDGRVFVAGGTFAGADGGPCEILDSQSPEDGWQLGPNMTYTRGYHSAAILLSDGSVLMGGDPNSGVFERYYPSYCSVPRPAITNAPAAVAHGATFTVDTPQAAIATEATLIRPGAVTHGFNMSQRAIVCEIVGGTAATVDVQAPPDGNIAPPGWYLLFLLDANRVPSIGRWLRLG
jgi:FtsP/CotA-like multicopper oxidase with cupredoxin domain